MAKKENTDPSYDEFGASGAMGLSNLVGGDRPKNSNRTLLNIQDQLKLLNKQFSDTNKLTRLTVDNLVKNTKATSNLEATEKSNSTWMQKIYEALAKQSTQTEISLLEMAETLREGIKGTDRKEDSSIGNSLLGGGGNPFGNMFKRKPNGPKKPGFLNKLLKFGGRGAVAEGEAALGGAETAAIAGGETAVVGGAETAGIAAVGGAALPIALIGAAAVGALTIFTHWKETKELAKSAMKEGQKLLGEVGPVIGSFAQQVIPAARDMLGKAFDSFKGDGGSEFTKDATALFDSIKNGVKSFLTKAIDKIPDLLASAQQWLADTFSPENIRKMLNTAMDTLKKLIDNGGRAIANGASAIVDGAKNLISKAPKAIGDVVSGAVHGAAELISKLEGLTKSGKAYNDVGHTAVGYGHDVTDQEFAQGYIQIGDQKIRLIGNRGIDTRLTKAQATALLDQDKGKYTDRVARALGQDTWNKLNDQQKAALTSYAYNTGGVKDLVKRGLKQAIDAGDTAKAAEIIKTGKHTAKGKNLEVLVERRAIEADQFAKASIGNAVEQASNAPSASAPANAQNKSMQMAANTSTKSPSPQVSQVPKAQTSNPGLPGLGDVLHQDPHNITTYNSTAGES